MGNDLITRDGEVVPAYFEKERPVCPFYGFNGMFGGLIDSRGNQCALVKKSYSPCQMELDGETPDWHNCPLNTEGAIEAHFGSMDIRAFPKELRPSEDGGWSGVSLEDWIRHIVDR